ncbi:MAG: hypothetical protein D8M58_01015 [Calditrichaeota bacterium]|nr:MAG: hypothetical protein DWQ03_06065 [Calditrichota bacterium]MBL1203948.1 hypothetical protein [Calditrichota bacterium]NOG43779.1 hypothetical protein [Calditrichota bacterium]
MKLFSGAVLLIVTFTALFTCNRNSEKTISEKKGGSINIAIQGNADNLFPFNIREYYTQEINSNLLSQSLTIVNPDGDIQPQLAKSWQAGHNQITYVLKGKVKWSNGQHFTAKDVSTTFYFINQNQDKISTLFNTDLISEIEIVDSLTIRFKFKEDVSEPHSVTRFPILNNQQIKNAENWDNLKKSYYEDFVGCGPFLLKKYYKNEIQLIRNEKYDINYPLLDEINVKFFSSTDTLNSWLESASIDLMPDLPHNLLKSVKKLTDFEVISSVEPGYTFLGWNLKNEETVALAFRKGLSHALDRQTMVDGIMSGYATVFDSPAYPEFWAYHQTDPLEFDLEKSRKYLNEAGWFTNKTTRRLEKDGSQLKLKILTNNENDLRVKVAINIKAYWEAIGAEVTVVSVPWGDFLKALKSKEYDAALISWVASDKFDPTELYHSSGIKSDNNFMGYANDSVDFFIENALSSKHKSSREKNWLKFQKKIIQDMPVTVLFGKRILNVVSKNLKNVTINSDGFLYNAKEYWLDDRK